jgi:acyl-CoA synthetase (AMP-forming)/AMP-acid ligase II
LEQGAIGEIHVSGTSVPGHYFGDERRNETVPTGDLGFLLDGQVFVTGRTKDLIVRGGKKIAAHDVERCVEDLGDLGPGSAIAFSCIDFTRSRERLVILLDERAQRTLGKDPDAIMDRVSRGIGLAVDVLEFVPATALPRTTSGKLRREEARRAYVDASRLKEELHGRP